MRICWDSGSSNLWGIQMNLESISDFYIILPIRYICRFSSTFLWTSDSSGWFSMSFLPSRASIAQFVGPAWRLPQDAGDLQSMPSCSPGARLVDDCSFTQTEDWWKWMCFFHVFYVTITIVQRSPSWSNWFWMFGNWGDFVDQSDELDKAWFLTAIYRNKQAQPRMTLIL